LLSYLDLFSGIGGFTLGLEQAGYEFSWHGYSEIDKTAIQIYKRRFKDATGIGSIRNVQPGRLPGLDLITFGSPCQDLSISGRRGGLNAKRSGLFFEAMQIIRIKKPKYFIFENVKGLFSSNGGRDFDVALRTITDIGYDCQWQVCNTRLISELPQQRERIYIVGHIRGQHRPQVFPIGNYDEKVYPGLKQIGTIGEDDEASRVYDPRGPARTIKNGGGMGAKTGLYMIDGRIRRLSPLEAERLQGFEDGFTQGFSDAQRYKCLGNAVSVPVVAAIAKKLKW